MFVTDRDRRLSNREAAYRMSVVTQGHRVFDFAYRGMAQQMFEEALNRADLVTHEKFAGRIKMFARKPLIRRISEAFGVLRGNYAARRLF